LADWLPVARLGKVGSQAMLKMVYTRSFLVVGLIAGGSFVGSTVSGGSPDLAAAGAVAGLIVGFLLMLGRSH
jgi:outer membrane lipoprotein SlyB